MTLQLVPAPIATAGSRFSEVWNAVCSDPYRELPQRLVRLRHALRPGTLREIYQTSRRTLRAHDDLLPAFDKSLHPVGICLRGRWRIDVATPYSGYFKQGSEGLVIARASDTQGETRPGKLRFLSMAGKLYPTTDANHSEPLPTADFVLSQTLLGSHSPHYLDAALSSDLLPLRLHADATPKLIPGLLSFFLFALADRAKSVTQALRRQLDPIASLAERNEVRAPAVMRLVPHPDNPRIDHPDFRVELERAQHPHGIRYAIEVARERGNFVQPPFTRIGALHFSEAIASWTGDHRLHFHHAAFRR